MPDVLTFEGNSDYLTSIGGSWRPTIKDGKLFLQMRWFYITMRLRQLRKQFTSGIFVGGFETVENFEGVGECPACRILVLVRPASRLIRTCVCFGRVPELIAMRMRIILPHSRFKITWDLFILVFVVYNTLMIPIELGFDFDTPTGQKVWD